MIEHPTKYCNILSPTLNKKIMKKYLRQTAYTVYIYKRSHFQ